MRPYNIKSNTVSSIWIDLDHILAIYDPIIEHENASDYSRYAVFSIVVAFRNDPIAVYSQSYKKEHMDAVFKAHADLLAAWKAK